MTKTAMPPAKPLEKHNEGDFLCTVAETVFQLIMETDVEGVIGAGRHECAETVIGLFKTEVIHRRGP